MARNEQWYVTSFCNFAHRLSDGKPINHECWILNPAALKAERAGDYEKARELLNGRRVHHRGVKAEPPSDAFAPRDLKRVVTEIEETINRCLRLALPPGEHADVSDGAVLNLARTIAQAIEEYGR